jgi:hypothetical protein
MSKCTATAYNKSSHWCCLSQKVVVAAAAGVAVENWVTCLPNPGASPWARRWRLLQHQFVPERGILVEDHVWFEDQWMVASSCDE